MAGLGARLGAERYLGMPIDRERHAADLKAALGGIKGPLMKVAQLLATIPEALPEEYVRELLTLQANAPAMGWPFVRRRMAGELGRRLAEPLQELRARGGAGRVAGTGASGRSRSTARLACKLQYPEMGSAVEADLRQLRLAMGIYERYDRTVSTAEIHAEIADRLREELDYEREAAHMRLYGEILTDEPGVAVPRPIAELSTRRLLTMTWLEGRPILEFAENASVEERNEIALRMFRTWYVPFYYYGVIHGDPHLGNYTVAPGTIAPCNLLAGFRLRPDIPAGFRQRRDRPVPRAGARRPRAGGRGVSQLGVRRAVARIDRGAEPLGALCLRPAARRPRPDDPGARETGRRTGSNLVDDVHRDLRRLGGIAPPRAFVFMDRAAVGLGSVFLHLQARINWHRLFHELIEDFDEAVLARRQRDALIRAGVPLPTA